MSAVTVDWVQSSVGAIVDQDEVTSNISSTDYSLRLKYINLALREWADTMEWRALFSEYNVLISTSTGNASVSLPSNFRKSAGPVTISWTSGTTDVFPDTNPQESSTYNSSDKRVEFLGNYQDNYTLRVYGVTLASGASVKVPFYTSVQSLASPADIAEIPNPDYLVKRTVAYLWEAREDARYPDMKIEAERILRNMIEYENVFPFGSHNERIRTNEERTGFRIGRD